MSGSTGRQPRVTLARDAVEFVDRVEGLARQSGQDEPHLHHWVAEACDRAFLARTIARESEVGATRTLMLELLAAETYGPKWPRETVLDLGRQLARRRGDRQVRAWHLVLLALQRFGIAARDAEDVVLPAEEPPVRGSAPAPGASATAAPASSPASPGSAASPSPAGPARPRRRAQRTRPVPTPLLDQCGTDWTMLAARGELPPCVGRDEERRLVIEALCRPAKANVVLVGEPGVGKSALIEGVAQDIADGRVPDALKGRPLIALNLAEVNRDSRYYGVMEQRLTALVEEAKAADAILFIDEIHTIVGAGGREGTGDVASVIKPALARGELSVIGATTEDEYRRFIVPNGALERRFNVVRVLEPGREAVREMVAAHADALAKRHGVRVGDEALDRLVQVTAARLAHRREPDRSRDLLDQAAARAIAAGAADVSADDIEATARAVSGAPEVTDASLLALSRALSRDGVLEDADTAALADRLGIAFAGLALRPARPRASMLLLRRAGGPDGFALAEAVARHVYGAPERVVAIDVGGIREASGISGLIGTTPGYIGHGAPLPIHALMDRPHSVLLLRGVDSAHESLRALLAAAIRDGYLAESTGKRIHLSSAVVVLEASLPARSGRGIGFAAGAPRADAEIPSDPRAAAHDAVGEELAGELDLVVVPPPLSRGAGIRWISGAMLRLADAYRSAGVELAWDADVEAALGEAMAGALARDRERILEASVGRVVRPHLRPGRRLTRARVRRQGDRLVAEVDGDEGLAGNA